MHQIKGNCFILFSALGSASVSILGKSLVLEGVDVWSILWIRFGSAALLLWSIILFTRSRANLLELLPAFAIGVGFETLQNVFFFLGIEYAGASITTLLLYMSPIFVFMIQHAVHKSPATLPQWAALLISLLGGYLAIQPFSGSEPPEGYLFGIACGLMAAMIFGTYIATVGHVLREAPPLFASALMMTGAFTGISALRLMQPESQLPVTSTGWILALTLGMVATAIPRITYVRGIQITGPVQASLLFSLTPIAAMIGAVLLFDESLGFSQALGCALVIGASAVLQLLPEEPQAAEAELEI